MENRIIRKYVEKNASPNVLLRGKRLFGWQYTAAENIDFEQATAFFRVRSELHRFREYEVYLSGFDTDEIQTSCTCTYDGAGICKHRVAALLETARQLSEKKLVYAKYDPADYTLSLPVLSESLISAECGEVDWEIAQRLVENQQVKILSAIDEKAEIAVKPEKESFNVILERITVRQVHTSCTCHDDRNPLCVHKVAALLKLREQFGEHAFDEMRDWEKEKNDLLAEYGYSLADTIEKKFDFKVVNRQLELIVLDKSIHKLSRYQDWDVFNRTLFYQSREFDIPELSKSNALKKNRDISLLIYLVEFDPDTNRLPGLTITVYKCRQSLKTGKFTYIRDIRDFQGEPDWVTDEDDIEIGRLTRALSSEELFKYIKAEEISYRGNFWEEEPILKENFRTEGFLTMQDYVGEHLAALLPLLNKKKVFLNTAEVVTLTHDDLVPLQVSFSPVQLSFSLKEESELIALYPFLTIEGNLLPLKKFSLKGYWLVQYGDVHYKFNTLADANLINYFTEHGAIKVKSNNFGDFFRDFITPLANRYPLEWLLTRSVTPISLPVQPKLYVKELDRFLLLVPVFVYDYQGDIKEFKADGSIQFVFDQPDGIVMLQRDTAKEKEVTEFIRSLHPSFAQQTGKPYCYLSFDEVMKNEWFFTVFDKIREKEIPVFGFNALTNLKYNPHRPQIQMRTSSGIDWFELQVQISFGDQVVSLVNVRQAVLNKQNYVQLGDGSLGILPEEWLQKYASIFRLGNVKEDHIELSKKHFSVVDLLYDEIDNLEVQQEIREKKQKLLNFKEIPQVTLPTNIRATMRDYQIEGFKWLNFLDEFGWGGCLADDMGLGKTLQVLAFLQYQKERYGRVTSLVVVPTTLIFNWNAEVEKFCPDLKIYTHRGLDRRKGIRLFDEYDIILTTYGTVRSDVELLAAYSFHYVILDESQAIKNPNSQIAKAVKLLRAKNRLVMTGTPIENNTFDLYSQMDFLNPGLLGGQDFFKAEYAMPIDKFRDAEKAQELRKMVYPFMLKRTKEEVAKDLPDKTETVLYCEMESHQRKVYEAFKQQYKDQIIKKISEEGLNKTGFLILEGLLKLRQICDSPALLSGDEDYGNESAKLTELIREIEENASNHKILIFSQFLKMLDLIREKLDLLHIKYQYLDGQTVDRAEKVNTFQDDAATRVFLISLKAGGVGINLTEADYVYLVDPWWNPAVEQQAIDRTHRIGQTKKIFAYRMICKDSIEEKILQLQERKKLVAEDIISTEAGFMKKLTQEDIVDLFN